MEKKTATDLLIPLIKSLPEGSQTGRYARMTLKILLESKEKKDLKLTAETIWRAVYLSKKEHNKAIQKKLETAQSRLHEELKEMGLL